MVVKAAGDAKKREALIIVALVAVIAVLAALNAGRFFLRLDLSRNGMFSISQVSKGIAQGLSESISITYYKSAKLAARDPFPQAIQDILGEYAVYSGGKISLTVVDPAALNNAPSPESLGVIARQMQVAEKGELNLATVYSGIVIRYLDRTEVLPFVTDPGTLEYEVSSKIRSLVSKKERAVGILLGDAQKSPEQDYQYLIQELESQYGVQTVQRGEDVPPNITELLVIGNRDLDLYDLFPIDQFIMSGGKAIFAVDAIDIAITTEWQAAKTAKTAVFDMLAGYGVRVKGQLVLDNVCQRLPFRTQNGQIMIVPYPFWITVTDASVSKESRITSRWAGLDLFWPSPLEIVERQGVKAEKLVSTSAEGWTMSDDFQINPMLSRTPSILESGPSGTYSLALALTGTFKSWFQDREIPTREGEKPKWTSIKASSGTDGRLIVVGDADFASDMIQYTQAEYNPLFISNCLEWLGMQEDLLTIKTKSQADIRLNKITEPAAKTRAILFVQILNIAVIPLCVVAFWVVRILLRRRGKNGRQEDRETT
jgi:gliding-associated putative ABC transporter substrate-binding component GldG